MRNGIQLSALLGLVGMFLSHSPLNAYTLEGEKWSNGTITMNLQLTLPGTTFPLQDGSLTWNIVAEQAMADWNGNLANVQFAANFDTSYTPKTGDGNNSIFFSASAFGQSFGTDVLAITLYSYSGSTMREADIAVNTADTWNSYRGNLQSATDLHRVLDHELGHVLGLGHPDQAGQSVTAVMNSVISNLDHLAADDISGGQDLYSAPTTSLLTVLVDPPGSGTVGGGGSFTIGSTEPIFALNGSGIFKQWSDGNLSTTRSVGTPQGGAIYTAEFSSAGVALYFQNGLSLGILSLGSNFQPSGWQGVGAMTAGWQQCAVADINGDGVPDIIFQNGVLLGALIMNSSGTPTSWVGIGSMGPGWQLRGAAQITGDGNMDLIFQNGTLLGFLEVSTSGTPLLWSGIGAMGTGWQLRAVANMSGDGHPDLLFQNGAALGALELDVAGLPVSWNGVGAMGSGWILSDAIDVDGDGQPDLIFQNGTSLGALQVSTSFSPVAWHGVGGMGPGWVLPGDY